MNALDATLKTAQSTGGDGVGGADAPAYARLVEPGGGLDVSHGPILYLDDITVSFDGFRALNKLTLTVESGELRCIIGPNGAGKTTMMDVITGKTRPDSGTAFFGQTIDLLRLSEPQIAHAGIGRKFQKPTVFENHSVFENLELAMKTDKRVKASLLAKLDSAQQDRIAATMELIRLSDQAARPAGLLVAWPEAVAGNRHAAHAGAAPAAPGRAGGRNDGCRDRAHRRTVQFPGRQALAGGG